MPTGMVLKQDKLDNLDPTIANASDGTHKDSDEKTPLSSATPWAPSKVVTFLFCSATIGISIGLINFNRWLMQDNRFPYAIPLCLIHMCFATVLALFLLVLKPSVFPAITDPDNRVEMNMMFFLKSCLPIGLVFAVSLVLSNMAYTHLGLAFIQMIKETNLIWVYIMSLLCVMERFNLRFGMVITLAIIASGLTIKGSVHFELIGLVIQLAAVINESVRIILQGILLQGKKLDPLSYVLISSPFCAAILAIVIFILAALPNQVLPKDMAVPAWSEVWHWAPWIVADGLVAFCLNVSVAVTIKYTSPMSYIFVQIVKDIITVIISVIFLHEVVGHMQTVGFVIQVCCVLTWSLMKSNPAKFEHGFIAGYRATLFGYDEEKKEILSKV